MKRIGQVVIQCVCVAALIDVGACSSEEGLASSPEVQAAGEGHDLRFSKKSHHKKKKKKHHFDDCSEDAGMSEDAGTAMCQNLSLRADSIKHREDTQQAEGTINVRVPETLSVYFWGKRVQAQLTFQQGDKRVVCTYAARRHRLGSVTSALELDNCDNGAQAGDSVAIDSATLGLDCARLIPIAKVWVDLPEIEPCGGMPMMPACDPANVDDDNPCTDDFCDANGVQHKALDRGTSCADDNVCNGEETCDGQGACVDGTAPTPPQPGVCQTRMCDPQRGWVLVGTTGASCADNDVCNGEERCTADGTCGAGTALDADDNNLCTTDACDAAAGVTHVPVNSDDNNRCTTDSCNAATGVTHVPVNSDDNNRCTTDSCNAASGVVHEPVNPDDNNMCTTDSCDPMTGVEHEPVPTNDDNLCTIDDCDPAVGVTHEPNPIMEGLPCGFSRFCQNGTCVVFN